MIPHILLLALFLSTCSGWRWPGQISEPYQERRSYEPERPYSVINRRVYEDELDNTIYESDDLLGHLSHLEAQLYMQPDNRTGDKVSQWHEGMGVNPEELGEYAEGDILYPASQGRNGIKAESARWPNGIVPYVLSPFFGKLTFFL